MINVLHITAHLGGGIGKALSGLVSNSPPEQGIRHEIACLEPPAKVQFMEKLSRAGCRVIVAPSIDGLAERIEAADIVQLEWWGHPATIAALCSRPLPAMRLLVWCHVSGIHTPVIPSRLLTSAHCFLFSSPCSYEAAEVARLSPVDRMRTGVIHSSGGFTGLEAPERDHDAPLAAGYLGSLNFAKLHPHYIEFLSHVDNHGFTVRMIGDITNRDILEEQCRKAGRPGMLEFVGYTTDVASELAAINVLPYLLNPCHYGTSENALLEAMAMGVVPIVLDNPAERCLVKDRETGLIVNTPREFANAVSWLARHPDERRRMSRKAAATVLERFAVKETVEAFTFRYASVNAQGKTFIPFTSILGRTPVEWFLVNQKHPEFFTDELQPGLIDEFILPGLFERTKGSLFHYARQFPDDARLSMWAENLSRLALQADKRYRTP
jgi:glycosyltransferase involved in cell wall biosynthesis